MEQFQIGNKLYGSLVGRVPQNPNYAPYRRRDFGEIQMVIVHHTASDTFALTAEVLAAYMANPDNPHAYPSIPYHCVIEQDGHVVVCQSLDTLTWHADGRPAIEGVGINNWRGVGVVLVGDFTYHWPTNAQLLAARELLAEISYAMGKALPVVKHSQVQATACPGATSGQWFESIIPPGG